MQFRRRRHWSAIATTGLFGEREYHPSLEAEPRSRCMKGVESPLSVMVWCVHKSAQPPHIGDTCKAWEGQRGRCPSHLFTPHHLFPAHLHRVRLRGGIRVAAGVVGGLVGLRYHGDAGNAEGIHAHRLRLVAWREA